MKPKRPGEFQLIETIAKARQHLPESLLKSIGDDCAVLDAAQLGQVVLSKDLLIEDVHFRNCWTSPYLLGMKSVRVNLSDLCSMGARQVCCLLGLGLPEELTDTFFTEFIRGFLTCCQEDNIPLIGGDLSKADKLTISVTAIGSIREGQPLYRSGAEPGDSIMLTGRTGLSRRGLNHIRSTSPEWLTRVKNPLEVFEHEVDPDLAQCILAHLLPEVFTEAGQWLQSSGAAHSMIDISDGLGNDLLHILEESKVAGEVYLDQLPRVPGVEDLTESRHLALSGGEDYALLWTASEEQLTRIEREAPAGFPHFRRIGRIEEGEPQLFLVDAGTRAVYQREGFDHFK